MIENRSLGREVPPITPRNVMDVYRAFQVKAQFGFATEEERLGDYRELISTASAFFNQKGDRAPNPKNVRDLAGLLFYSHKQNSPVQLDFFVEATEKVTKDVLRKGWAVKPLSYKWEAEIDEFKNLLQGELRAVTINYEAEKADADKIREMALKGVILPEQSPEAIEIKTIEQRRRQVEETMVATLAKSPDLRSDVQEVENYAQTLGGLNPSTPPTPQELRQSLDPYKEIIEIGDEGALKDIYLHAEIGDYDYINDRLTELGKKTSKTDLLFGKWTKDGTISAEVYSSFGELMTLSELQEASKALVSENANTKARYLKPFLEKGISASLIREVAEGKFELTNDVLAVQIESYLDFCKDYTKQATRETKSAPWSRKKKIAVAIIAATIAASPFIYKGIDNLVNPPPNIIEEISEEIDQQESEGVYASDYEEEGYEGESGATGQEGMPGVPGGTGGGRPSIGREGGPQSQSPGELPGFGMTIPGGDRKGTGSGNENPDGNSKPSEGPVRQTNFDSDLKKPVNDSPEKVLEAQKQIVWELEGSDLRGLYRARASSRFAANEKGWVFNRTILRGQPVFSQRNDIQIKSTEITLTNRNMVLPSRYTYAPSAQSVRVEGATIQPRILQLADGSYTLEFANSDLNKKVKVNYSLGKTERSPIPKPSPVELKDMTQKYIEIADLPEGELKEFMKQVDKSGYEPEVKMRLIEKYVQKNFIYSLDSKWSDDYHSKRDVKAFFRRIVEIKKCDCDVANTATIMLLRTQGIPARFIYGSNHNSAMTKDEKKINAAESHGWAEAYIKGKWYDLDATPSNMDELTKKALEGNLSQSERKKLEENQDFIRETEKWYRWIKDDSIIPGLLLLTGLNILAGKAAKLGRLKNHETRQRLAGEVDKRARAYLGPAYKTLNNHFTDRENFMSSRHDPEFGSFLGFIPPVNFNDLSWALARAIRLRRDFPYSTQDTPSITTADQPNLHEFMTKVLGYNEKQVKKEIWAENYAIAKGHISEKIGIEAARVYSGDIFEGYYPDSLHKAIGKLKPPEDEAQWQATVTRLTDSLYNQYLKSRAKEEKELLKGDDNPVIPASLTRNEYQTRLNNVLRYKLAEWVLKDRYAEIR